MVDPWVFWLSACAVLGPAELLSRRLIAAAGSIGSLSGALAEASGATVVVQCVVAAAVLGVGLCVHRPLLRPYHRAIVNSVSLYGDLGKLATVTEPVDGQAGQIRYGGVAWQARSPGKTIGVGTKVKVSGLLNDMTLWVFSASGPHA